MWQKFFLLNLCFGNNLYKVTSETQKDPPGYYCRYNDKYEICLRSPDLSKPQPKTQQNEHCVCDNIAITNKNNDLVGGPDCQSTYEDTPYCFVGK